MKKERKYRRITWTDRLKIEALYNAGHSYRFIAAQIGFTSKAVVKGDCEICTVKFC